MAEDVIVHVDGACSGNPGPAAFGLVVTDGTGQVLRELGGTLPGPMTNNEAEYHAVLKGLWHAHDLAAAHVLLRSDSQWVVRQITGRYGVSQANLAQLCDLARRRMARFPRCQIEWVPREQNARADALASEALGRVIGPDVFSFHNFQAAKSRIKTLEASLAAITGEVERLRGENQRLRALERAAA